MRLTALTLAAVLTLSVGYANENENEGDLDRRLASMGFVDIETLGLPLTVDLMYARDDNFVGQAMYEGLTRAWLHPRAARALQRAARALQAERPGWRMKICDASRPMSVQRRMYDKVRGTSQAPYVSNPANGGGMHNYGLAVDITLIDVEGREVDMGTAVDHLGAEAHIDGEAELVRKGVITSEAASNRRLLRRVMKAGGWMPLRTEWWHFNLVRRTVAKRDYRCLNF